MAALRQDRDEHRTHPRGVEIAQGGEERRGAVLQPHAGETDRPDRQIELALVQQAKRLLEIGIADLDQSDVCSGQHAHP